MFPQESRDFKNQIFRSQRRRDPRNLSSLVFKDMEYPKNQISGVLDSPTYFFPHGGHSYRAHIDFSFASRCVWRALLPNEEQWNEK